MFDTSIKTPKTPLTKRLGYLLAALLLIGAGFWVVGTLSSMLLGAMAPQVQPQVIEQPYTPATQPVEVMIELDDGQSTDGDQ